MASLEVLDIASGCLQSHAQFKVCEKVVITRGQLVVFSKYKEYSTIYKWQ